MENENNKELVMFDTYADCSLEDVDRQLEQLGFVEEEALGNDMRARIFAQTLLRKTLCTKQSLISILEANGFSPEDIEFAVEHGCKDRWMLPLILPSENQIAQILKNFGQTEEMVIDSAVKAKITADIYMTNNTFSDEELVIQLMQDGYSSEDAEYAVDNCCGNWFEHAFARAKSYVFVRGLQLNTTELIDQLISDGFSEEDSAEAVNKLKRVIDENYLNKLESENSTLDSDSSPKDEMEVINNIHTLDETTSPVELDEVAVCVRRGIEKQLIEDGAVGDRAPDNEGKAAIMYQILRPSCNFKEETIASMLKSAGFSPDEIKYAIGANSHLELLEMISEAVPQPLKPTLVVSPMEKMPLSDKD